MHVQDEIVVLEDDYNYAQKLILPSDMAFNEPRREFLSDFSTLDLKAVPGSGKTTLLLAKLAILEKKLPLKSGKSVLVLSHTNTAVDEIYDRLSNHCPELFKYPNHVGTIQSFVNQYLAIPYFESIMKKKIVSIDDEYYNKTVEMKYEKMQDCKLKAWLKKQNEPVKFLKSIRFNNDGRLVKYINGKIEDFPLKDNQSPSYMGLLGFKMSLYEKGILHYDDAYFLANRYLKRYPEVIEILRKRFGYVFVDEMQDMDSHQFEILELFNADEICFQRLGDNNQAIYSNIVHSDNLWSLRENTKTIDGSYRLTPQIASLASRFSVDGVTIIGQNNLEAYKPILVVFDDSMVKCEVIKSFSSYVEELIEDKLEEILDYNVVAWRKEHDEGKLSLREYCPKYLQMKKNTVKRGNLEISNAQIIKGIFELIGAVCSNEFASYEGEVITKSNVEKLFYEVEQQKEHIQKALVEIVLSYRNNEIEKMEDDIRKLLAYILTICDVDEYESIVLECKGELIQEFLFIEEEATCKECSIIGNQPCVGTVHSVKGETHDVTLFLESFFSGKYEVDILSEVIVGTESVESLINNKHDEIGKFKTEIQEIINTGKTRGILTREKKIAKCERDINTIKQYSKLLYVALTRTRSILGYAINKSRYEEYLRDKINNDEWELLFLAES